MVANSLAPHVEGEPVTRSEPSASPATGPAAAAILAVGIGVFTLGLCAILGDAFRPVAAVFNWVPRTGPLSGVTGCAIVLWLATWWVLRSQWQSRPVALRRINVIAALLFLIGVLLSFFPFMDLLQGK